MGRHLIEPLGHAGIGIARHDGHRPFVVARTLRRVPGRGVAGAVIEQVQVRIIREPAPDRAAADLPLVAFPAVERAVGADGLAQMGGRLGVDQHFVVGAGGIGFPRLGPVGQIQRRHPAAHPVFAARDPDHQLVLDRHGGHGQGFADCGVADLGRPFHLAALGIQRHDGGVGLRQEDHAVGIGQATVDGIAAHHRDHAGILHGFIPPDDAAVVVQIQRKDVVGERRMDIHDVADHQRGTFVPAQHPGRERPGNAHVADVVAVDLVQFGIARVGIVHRRQRHLRRVGNRLVNAVVGQNGRTGQQKRHGSAGQRQFHLVLPLLPGTRSRMRASDDRFRGDGAFVNDGMPKLARKS